MKIGVIKERKNPPDKRVALTPETCQRLLQTHPELQIVVESSDIRAYTDAEYRDRGIEVVTDLTDCDVLIGVKEVPIEALIPHKTYFFFSHTIKRQPYNRELLRAILDKRIELHDHETLTAEDGHHRLVAFGRYAGMVGAYTGLRAYGLKTGQFEMPSAEELQTSDRIKERLTSMKWPPMRIVLTGIGRAGSGAAEILECLPFEPLSPSEFLEYTGWSGAYTQLDVLDYHGKTSGEEPTKAGFFASPEGYEADLLKYARKADLYIAAHYYEQGYPMLLRREDLLDPDFRVQVIADISCDIRVPIASTVRASTIADPYYGYSPERDEEIDFFDPEALGVMAVDNLPCEIPREASEGFSMAIEKHIIPAFFDQDSRGILQRSQITTSRGELAERFAYLTDYVALK